MRVLLDSHIFVWWADGKPLSVRIKRILEDPSTDLLFSLASAWELALKIERLGWSGRFEPLIQSGIRELRMTILGVNLEHIIYSSSLPWHHRDPFDCLLIAQALLEGVPILTQDRKIAQYTVPTLP